MSLEIANTQFKQSLGPLSDKDVQECVLPKNHHALMSTKSYGHNLGFSCAFRQWRAESHCKYVHGYALAFSFTFAADFVDRCGWVVDFGGLKSLKGLLEQCFDHTLLVAIDDPHLPVFQSMHENGIANVHIVPATGCEAFARMVYDMTAQWLKDAGFAPRCWLVSVEVSEHGANSAICRG